MESADASGGRGGWRGFATVGAVLPGGYRDEAHLSGGRMNTTLTSLSLVLALAACQQMPVPSTKLAQPEPLELIGTYVHAGSGIAFPEKAAGFARVAPQ